MKSLGPIRNNSKNQLAPIARRLVLNPDAEPNANPTLAWPTRFPEPFEDDVVGSEISYSGIFAVEAQYP
jgi:hypothetical protein